MKSYKLVISNNRKFRQVNYTNLGIKSTRTLTDLYPGQLTWKVK